MVLLERIRRRLNNDARLARMLHGGFSNLVARGLALIISAVTLPLTVRYLGKFEYGVWVTISTSVVMFSVLDLGIANTLTNFISEAYAEDDRAKAQGYFATAFWLTVGITVILGAASLLIWQRLDWGAVLNLKDPLMIERARMCVAISMAFFLLSLPLNLANRVLGGYQQVHISNYFAMINSVLGLVAILSVILGGGNMVHLMLAYCGAMLTGAVLLNLWLCLWAKPWIRPHPGKVSRAVAQKLFGQGALFFVLQLTILVVFNSDNLVITHFSGASEVTPYSVAWRLANYASLLQTMLLPSFWPAFTEAYQKREMAWVRGTYRSMVRKTMFAVTAAALLMGLAGQPVIRVWAGPAAVPSKLLLWTMAGWAVLSSLTTNQALLLTATGRLRLQTTVAVLAAITNLCLSIVLVQRIGSEGVILATIFSFAVFMVVPQGREVRQVLEGAFLPPTKVPPLLVRVPFAE
jgi:O-antigen/teichoic acid export membrane protein